MTNHKKVPLRKCVVSQQMLPKKELVRIVKTPNGEIIIDSTGKANGRGAYLRPTLEIYEKAKKKSRFRTCFKNKINRSILRNVILWN